MRRASFGLIEHSKCIHVLFEITQLRTECDQELNRHLRQGLQPLEAGVQRLYFIESAQPRQEFEYLFRLARRRLRGSQCVLPRTAVVTGQ